MKLSSLVRASRALSRYDRDMPISRVMILCQVAAVPGCLTRDLQLRTGLSQPELSAALARLGAQPQVGAGRGPGWVTQVPDPTDRERVRCFLTPVGERVMGELERLIA